jgi:hypothetical protein
LHPTSNRDKKIMTNNQDHNIHGSILIGCVSGRCVSSVVVLVGSRTGDDGRGRAGRVAFVDVTERVLQQVKAPWLVCWWCRMNFSLRSHNF